MNRIVNWKPRSPIYQVILWGMGMILCWSFQIPPGIAADLETGAKVFEVQCAGCHIKGGNIVRRNKTLKLAALQRNKVDTIAAITEIVANGKGTLMSAYRDRLSSDEIAAVSAYVLEQAQQGWR